MSLPDGGMFQVQDSTGTPERPRWHAAAVGLGVLCQASKRDVTVDTVWWAYGTDLVNCRDCLSGDGQVELFEQWSLPEHVTWAHLRGDCSHQLDVGVYACDLRSRLRRAEKAAA